MSSIAKTRIGFGQPSEEQKAETLHRAYDYLLNLAIRKEAAARAKAQSQIATEGRHILIAKPEVPNGP